MGNGESHFNVTTKLSFGDDPRISDCHASYPTTVGFREQQSVCTMKSPNQQLRYAPVKVNNINIRLSLTLYLQLLAPAAPQFVQQHIKSPKYDTFTLRQ